MLLCGGDGGGNWGEGGTKVNSFIYNVLGDLHCRISQNFFFIWAVDKEVLGGVTAPQPQAPPYLQPCFHPTSSHSNPVL